MKSIRNSSVSEVCILCGQGRDSIEHLPGGHVVKSLYTRNGLNLDSLAAFFGLETYHYPEYPPLIATSIAAIYLARNAIMHAPPSFFNPLELIIEMQLQI